MQIKPSKDDPARNPELQVEEEPEGGFKCPECDRVFTTERGMKVHKAQVHPEED